MLRNFAIIKYEYQQLVLSINTQISSIDTRLDALPSQIDTIILSSNNNLRITKDIRYAEDQLSSLYNQCNELRTKKEMLQYSLEYLNECMAKFCDINNHEEVIATLQKKTLDIVRYDHLDVDNEFRYYKEIISITKDHVEDIYKIFFIVKLYQFQDDAYKKAYMTTYLKDEEQEQGIKELKDEIDSLPRIESLTEAKTIDPHRYLEMLETLIDRYQLIQQLKNRINDCVCIGNRKPLLLKSLNLFENADYDLFNNVMPIQMEGLFGDYLKDGTIFYRFTNLKTYYRAVLKEKIKYIRNLGLDVFPEAVLYFNFYFNNLVRNKIAHGNYAYGDHNSSAILSIELLLDLNFLVLMLSRKSETEKMYHFIHQYKNYMSSFFKEPNHHFAFLFNDLTGNRTHFTYDSVDIFRPIQFAYWLVNPYYEEIFGRIGDVQELLSLRNDFLSNEFWVYVYNKLDHIISTGHNYIKIDREFYSVVKAMFSCNVTNETKKTLAKVNAALALLTPGYN